MRSCSDTNRRLACLAVGVCLLALLIGAPPALALKLGKSPSAGARWLTDWQTASAESRLEGRPLLVVSTLPQCPWCREFDKMATEERVRNELEGLVLLRLDLTANPDVADQLGLTGAPVAVLLSATGIAAARQEGYAPADEFVQWLRDARGQAEKLAPLALASGPVEDLIPLLGHQDPVVRQMAIGMLTDRGERTAVVEAFATGGLAVRLNAAEVLAAWQAPLGKADPWKPDTVPPVLDQLRTWAGESGETPGRAVPEPGGVQDDLHAWMTAEDGPVTQAVYERLAGVGPDLLPLIEERMPPTWDRGRRRLMALRYRLLLPDEHARRLPNVPFRMASASPQTRLQALNVLSERPDAALKDFFVEATRDPDGKVREAAVRGLLHADGDVVREELTGMLADPSPEVRATVLKELARSPSVKLVNALTTYVAEETEEDLIVLTAGILGDLRADDAAFEALLGLMEHESWRVRAAAVQALSNVGTSSSIARRRLVSNQQTRLVTALKKALQDDDVFVVAKTIEALTDMRGANLRDLRDGLAEIARKDTEMARAIVPILAEDSSLQPQGRQVVRELCKHEVADVRAFALEALADSVSSLPTVQVLAGLKDEAREVRIVAAGAIMEADLDEVVYERSSSSGLFGSLFGGGSGTTSRRRISEQVNAQLLDALRPMTSSDDAEERLAALCALGVLGEPDLAFPGLEEVLMSHPDAAAQALRVLPALDWQQRRALFDLARQTSLSQYVWAHYLNAVAEDAPKTEDAYLWHVFDEDPYVTAAPEAILRAMVEFYMGEIWFYSRPDAQTRPSSPALAAQAQKRLGEGDPVRRAIALILLRAGDEKEGKAAVAAVMEGAGDQVPEVIRCVAVELAFLYGDLDLTAAVACLDDPNAAVQRAAATFAAGKVTPFSASATLHVGEETVYLYDWGFETSYAIPVDQDAQPRTVPDGFPLETLERVAADAGGELAHVSTYLRACRGDDEAFKRLLADAQERFYDTDFAEAVVLAVAARGNDDEIKHAAEVYGDLDSYQRGAIAARAYSAFSGMRGPNALKFRRTLLRDRRRGRAGW